MLLFHKNKITDPNLKHTSIILAVSDLYRVNIIHMHFFVLKKKYA